MNDEIFPRHYKEWKDCITQKCKIELTQDYIKKRIAVLSDPESVERQKFDEKYGSYWTKTILDYFKQAQREKEL